MAGLHGSVRSARPRDRTRVGPRDAACGRDLRRPDAKKSAPAIRRAVWATIWRSTAGRVESRNAQAQNIKKIVSICPHCVRTIGTDWREAGATFEIEHHSEFLARLINRLPSPPAGARRVVYHDPCYLGRYRDVYDEPRAVIAQTGEVVDPPRSRERSFCCGAGGGQMFLGEEKGKRVNIERVEELVATGAR